MIIFELPLKADIIKRTLVQNIDKDSESINLIMRSNFKLIGLKTQILELPINLLHKLKLSFVPKNNELAVLLEKNKEVLIARPKFGIKTHGMNFRTYSNKG